MEDQIILDDLAISFNDDIDQNLSDTPTDPISTDDTPDVVIEEPKNDGAPTTPITKEDDSDIETTKGYFNFLKTNNLLVVDDDFEFDGSEEKLKAAQEATIYNYQKMAIGAIMESLPEDFRDLLNYTLNGGKDYKQFLSTETFDNSTPEGQAAIITNYYKNELKWDDSKINRFLQKMDEDELADEAKELETKIKEKQATAISDAIKAQELAEVEAEKERNRRIQEITSSIENANFLEAKRKATVKNFVFNSVRKTDGVKTDFQRVLSEIQNNPNHLVQLADLLIDYDKQKGIAYERFEKKAETKLTQSLKENLNKTIKTKVEQISNPSKGNDINWASFINN